MTRRLLNLVTALSLLLSVLVGVAWLASQWGGRFGYELIRHRPWWVTLDQGLLRVDHFLPDHADSAAHDWGWHVPYVAYYRHCWGRRAEWTWTGVYLLPVAGFLAALPLARWSPTAVAMLRRHLRGHPPGGCKRCGYDLRATPDSCPECGTPADSSCA